MADYSSYIKEAANKYDLPNSLLTSLIERESNFNPSAISGAGAQGLMQVMPETARGIGLKNPFDPKEAIDKGAKLYKSLYDKFGSHELALAAYNSGEGNVKKYGGIPPFKETQKYVPAIMNKAFKRESESPDGNPFSLMNKEDLQKWLDAHPGVGKEESAKSDNPFLSMGKEEVKSWLDAHPQMGSSAPKKGISLGLGVKEANAAIPDPLEAMKMIGSDGNGKHGVDMKEVEALTQKPPQKASPLQKILSIASGPAEAMPFHQTAQKIGEAAVGLLPESMQQAGQQADIVSQAQQAAPGYHKAGEVIGDIAASIPQWIGGMGITKTALSKIPGLMKLANPVVAGAITGPALTTAEKLSGGELPAKGELELSSVLGAGGELAPLAGKKVLSKIAEKYGDKILGGSGLTKYVANKFGFVKNAEDLYNQNLNKIGTDVAARDALLGKHADKLVPLPASMTPGDIESMAWKKYDAGKIDEASKVMDIANEAKNKEGLAPESANKIKQLLGEESRSSRTGIVKDTDKADVADVRRHFLRDQIESQIGGKEGSQIAQLNKEISRGVKIKKAFKPSDVNELDVGEEMADVSPTRRLKKTPGFGSLEALGTFLSGGTAAGPILAHKALQTVPGFTALAALGNLLGKFPGIPAQSQVIQNLFK